MKLMDTGPQPHLSTRRERLRRQVSCVLCDGSGAPVVLYAVHKQLLNFNRELPRQSKPRTAEICLIIKSERMEEHGKEKERRNKLNTRDYYM